jgi:hypothetical protein
MADLEQRVTALEREMTALKARVDVQEEDARSIPDLIKVEFRLANSQMARLSSDVARLSGDMARLSDDVTGLSAKVDVLPRVVAEIVTEMLAERGKRD